MAVYLGDGLIADVDEALGKAIRAVEDGDKERAVVNLALTISTDSEDEPVVNWRIRDAASKKGQWSPGSSRQPQLDFTGDTPRATVSIEGMGELNPDAAMLKATCAEGHAFDRLQWPEGCPLCSGEVAGEAADDSDEAPIEDAEKFTRVPDAANEPPINEAAITAEEAEASADASHRLRMLDGGANGAADEPKTPHVPDATGWDEHRNARRGRKPASAATAGEA